MNLFFIHYARFRKEGDKVFQAGIFLKIIRGSNYRNYSAVARFGNFFLFSSALTKGGKEAAPTWSRH
jgi:hypothetical protein